MENLTSWESLAKAVESDISTLKTGKVFGDEAAAICARIEKNLSNLKKAL